MARLADAGQQRATRRERGRPRRLRALLLAAAHAQARGSRRGRLGHKRAAAGGRGRARAGARRGPAAPARAAHARALRLGAAAAQHLLPGLHRLEPILARRQPAARRRRHQGRARGRHPRADPRLQGAARARGGRRAVVGQHGALLRRSQGPERLGRGAAGRHRARRARGLALDRLRRRGRRGGLQLPQRKPHEHLRARARRARLARNAARLPRRRRPQVRTDAVHTTFAALPHHPPRHRRDLTIYAMHRPHTASRPCSSSSSSRRASSPRACAATTT